LKLRYEQQHDPSSGSLSERDGIEVALRRTGHIVYTGIVQRFTLAIAT
jgi:hypothetical protein